jgi:hypothetical protein
MASAQGEIVMIELGFVDKRYKEKDWAVRRRIPG